MRLRPARTNPHKHVVSREQMTVGELRSRWPVRSQVTNQFLENRGAGEVVVGLVVYALGAGYLVGVDDAEEV